MNSIITSHQQPWEPRRPIIQIPPSKRPNAPLDLIRHILVVVLLVPQSAQEIQQAVTRVLALLSKRVDESPIQSHEEVVLRADDDVRVGFEPGQMLRIAGVVVLVGAAGFALEVVADVAEEGEALLGGPEEGVVQDLEGRGAVFGNGIISM